MKQFIIKTAVVFFAFLGILTYFSGTIEHQLRPIVTATESTKGALEENIAKDAVVEYLEDKGLYSSGDFLVTDVLVNEGEHMETGTPVIQIDISDFNIGKEELALDITKVANEVASLNDELNHFYGTRKEKIALQNSIGEKSAELKIAQMNYNNFVRNIDEGGRLICQEAGTITTIAAEKGTRLEKGAEILQLATSEDSKGIVFELTREEKIHFDTGTKLQIKYVKKSEDNKETETKILPGILEKCIYNSEEKKYLAYGRVTENASELLYGENVRAELQTEGIVYENIVPVSAVIDDENGKNIYILREDEKKNYYVKKKRISVLDSNNYLAAVDVELEYGDRIITSTSKSLKDGMQVRIQ